MSDSRVSIDPSAFSLPVFSTFLDRWFLLTAGNYASGEYNTMTVAWGFVGAMWRRPMAIAAVRSTRFTFGFMNRYDTWTLSAFPESCRDDLELLGSRSGRDGDKVAATSLTPQLSTVVAAPTFAQADLVIECRTVYVNEIEKTRMRDASIDEHYDNDYHHMYYGEVLAVGAVPDGR